MSNTDTWALNDLRYSTVPDLQRRVANLEKDACNMREHIASLVARIEALESEVKDE
jgi:prefoldin subunit 5